jgi:hypothetical protein
MLVIRVVRRKAVQKPKSSTVGYQGGASESGAEAEIVNGLVSLL